MKLCVYLNPARLIRWHLCLIEDLSICAGHEVQVAFSQRSEPWPAAVRLIFRLESLIYGGRGGGLADPLNARELTVQRVDTLAHANEFEAVINLSGSPAGAPAAARILTPLFDGNPDELSIILALLDRRPLMLEVHDSANATNHFTALPAFEDQGIFSQSVSNALSRAAELVMRSLRQPSGPESGKLAFADRPSSPSPAQALQRVAATVTSKARAVLSGLLAGGQRWAVGWRTYPALSLLNSAGGRFQIVPDDGRRFFADPFVFEHRGTTYMFCEEFPYATSKGIISVFSRLPEGKWSAPVSIIEEPHHLSYPFIFEHEGRIWMVPESGQGRTVDLYLAVDFPFKWVKQGTLLHGTDAYDATLSMRDGRWWMFVTTRHRRSATSDNLEIYHAEGLTGPWLAHGLNPVMIDSRFSRSAGSLIARGEKILRPAQDCSTMYGGAVSLCYVSALDVDRYAQHVVGRLHARDFGVHTYNSSSGFEVVDVFGFVSGTTHAEIVCSPASPAECRVGA